MEIMSIQKLTLLDYPGKLACTVFLPGCNLRCPFCHNPALVLPQRIGSPGVTRQALLEFLSKRKGKLDGVCITGGEPTLYPDLPQLISEIRSLGFCVKLDTNGSHPQMLRTLLQQGLLDAVAMDIKNAPAKYALTCGGPDILNQVRESAELLMNSSISYEFRTTVCAPLHTPEDMAEISRWLQGASQYFLQPFVDSGDLVGSGIQALSQKELFALRDVMLANIPNTRIRGI